MSHIKVHMFSVCASQAAKPGKLLQRKIIRLIPLAYLPPPPMTLLFSLLHTYLDNLSGHT